MTVLDPAIRRWLKKLELEEPNSAPDADTFQDFVSRVDKHLKHLQSDRDLLTRTLETATLEMNELNANMRSQRDRLEQVMEAAAEALSVFSDIDDDHGDTGDISAAMRVARAKFATRLSEAVDEGSFDSSSSNSIRGLRQSFAALADQITTLVQGASEAASMRKQLEVAGAVQRMLVPEQQEQSFDGFELAAFFQPAATCGGDWWSVYPLAQGRTLIIVADVTGHGVPSAIITGAAKGATDLARTATRGKMGPGVLLRMLNSVIASASRRQYMMTAVALVIDRNRDVVMANAGHPSPLLMRDGAVKPLPSHRDPPLGSVDAHAYAETNFTLKPGDRLLVYTDGVTECVNPRNDEFGERRLRSLLGRSASATPKTLRDRIVEGLHVFADGAPSEDDVTFVALASL